MKLFCEITLKNTSDSAVRLKISADFSEDVGQLLKEESLVARTENGEDAVFLIPAKTEKTFPVLFVGIFAGVHKKK